ncbi:MAG: ABC transporter ATP-binding protein [Nocardioidaceae bacterium]|nr:ABC transporter ATP-binding protein [Nocardioidaceae bacterium]MDQ3325225.1 ABC transporter ATP-binding protein [Actinomycetota bacterium]
MRYGEVAAVDTLSTQLPASQVTAVVGPNGAGKTTTLETCEGFRRPQAGTVRVLGLDPARDAAKLRPRVGVMLQSGGAWTGCRVHEALRHAAALHAHPLDVDALVERLGLGSCGSTSYRRLSGGQQQRLGLAMAIVGRPELVFLDEPTAGLDPQARRMTWELVRELRDGGVTVVLATHFLDEAEQLADRVIVIDHGRIIAAGSPGELTATGAENTVRFTAVAGLDMHDLRSALPAGCTVQEVTPGGYLVTGPVDPALIATLTAWCAARGVLAQSLAVERRSLEDVFIELTGRELRP